MYKFWYIRAWWYIYAPGNKFNMLDHVFGAKKLHESRQNYYELVTWDEMSWWNTIENVGKMENILFRPQCFKKTPSSNKLLHKWRWWNETYEMPTCLNHSWVINIYPDNKVHGANMGPTWVLSAPDGPHVGPMNLAIRGMLPCSHCWGYYPGTLSCSQVWATHLKFWHLKMKSMGVQCWS